MVDGRTEHDMDASKRATPRRGLIAAAAAGAALGLAGCGRGGAPDKDAPDKDVGAVEDLMREHGVLRRVLVIYRATAPLVRTASAGVDAKQLWKAADLFRRFGEAYHEQMLEEQHIFPQVMKAGAAAAAGLVPTLLAQHARGRQITAYIQSVTQNGAVSGTDAQPLGAALETFARMYEPHTAFEDTIVFQAWRASLSAKQLDEIGDQFEDIEKRTFKGDGFDMAVDEVAAIEQGLGLADLARYTAPAPPGSPPDVGMG
jgi:hemerythrin-like domain-containing protein